MAVEAGLGDEQLEAPPQSLRQRLDAPAQRLERGGVGGGVGSADAGGVVIVDSLPAEVQFKVGSVVSNLPAGISVVVEYSDNGGSSWTYVPVSGGCSAPAGYDACVNRVRWTLLNDLSSIAPNNTGDVRLVARIN